MVVDSGRAAAEKFEWYAMQLKITETFHKLPKSGCRAEGSTLLTAQRLANLIAVFCIVSWRLFWLAIPDETAPAAPAERVLTASHMRW